MYLDLGDRVIIVEIDENQHFSYDCSCENRRLMEISRDVDHRPVVFIRFNPDDYLVGDVTVKSPWKNVNGIYTIPKNKESEWNRRLEVLTETVRYWIDNSSDRTVEVVNLWFDNG
jgi:hypothetical protein